MAQYQWIPSVDAFIYISMTRFEAQNWRRLPEVADSQTPGGVHWLPECSPGPTEVDYRVGGGQDRAAPGFFPGQVSKTIFGQRWSRLLDHLS